MATEQIPSLIHDPRWIQPLTGGRVRLRTPQEADLSFFMQCFASDEFMNQFHRSAPRRRREESVRAALKASGQAVLQSRTAHWLIELQIHPVGADSAWRPVGLASLAEIMPGNKRAELLVGIYDPADRGHGAAIIATLLLFDLSFNQIGLHKLTSIVLADNPLSQRSTLSIGFQQEGFRKQHLYDPYARCWQDCYENGLVEEDFRSNKRLARLSVRFLLRDITQTTTQDSQP